MHADWTAFGACTNCSAARPGGATRPAPGGPATTSTTIGEWRHGSSGATAESEVMRHGFRATPTASVPWRVSAALRRERGADDRLVSVHVSNGRDADARRLDDVDGVDADART